MNGQGCIREVCAWFMDGNGYNHCAVAVIAMKLFDISHILSESDILFKK